MAIVGFEWLGLIIIVIVMLIIIYKTLSRRRFNDMLTRTLRVIRYRGKATISDIIVFGNIPQENVYKIINKLFECGLINIIKRDGEISYVTLRNYPETLEEPVRSSKDVSVSKTNPKEDHIICPNCGYVNKPGARYCGRCGIELGVK